MTLDSSASNRVQSVSAAVHRPLAADPTVGAEPPSSYFGVHSLSWHALAAQLDGEASSALRDFALGRRKLSKEHANRVAEAIMRWSLKHGATHFAHWFHPLTNVPAEKHDAFLARGLQASLVPVEQFPGSLLLQGEPDASSFPSGGLRATHEARGYTVWDPTSPLFIRSDGGARTLCIPSAFVSWRGHALDYKTPLLRALDALNREAKGFLDALSGETATGGVVATLGTEQEYFLVDRALWAARPDLVMCGRTLAGAPPPRGQQLEDHYFAAIPARVQAYVSEVERVLYRLGVPVRTRHNEVAPGQFETAPVFEELNVACDHNVLTMDVLKRVAERHDFACLLHEKPFAGVNGSGKHNNWSLATAEGENLLEPGATPASNVRFLAVLAVIFRTMHEHNDVLRATIASAANDHRLGANEAPPAILSVYLGGALHDVVEAVASGRAPDVHALADIQVTARLSAKRELTDRNRTTPFAFTGNKFEFRAVGSSEQCAWPMTVLNAGVASSFLALRTRLEAKVSRGMERSSAALEVVREVFNETRAVRFEGNNYDPAWVEEAKKRGLPVNRDTPAALAVLAHEGRTKFLSETGVLSQEEIHSRYEVFAERYAKQVDIEATTLIELARTHAAPAAEAQLARSHAALGGSKSEGHLARRVKQLSEGLEALLGATDELAAAREKLHGHSAAQAMAHAAEHVLPAAARVRGAFDALEALVGDDLWSLPKYREMLFLGV